MESKRQVRGEMGEGTKAGRTRSKKERSRLGGARTEASVRKREKEGNLHPLKGHFKEEDEDAGKDEVGCSEGWERGGKEGMLMMMYIWRETSGGLEGDNKRLSEDFLDIKVT